jgi:hypothetical protein
MKLVVVTSFTGAAVAPPIKGSLAINLFSPVLTDNMAAQSL